MHCLCALPGSVRWLTSITTREIRQTRRGSGQGTIVASWSRLQAHGGHLALFKVFLTSNYGHGWGGSEPVGCRRRRFGEISSYKVRGEKQDAEGRDNVDVIVKHCVTFLENFNGYFCCFLWDEIHHKISQQNHQPSCIIFAIVVVKNALYCPQMSNIKVPVRLFLAGFYWASMPSGSHVDFFFTVGLWGRSTYKSTLESTSAFSLLPTSILT